mgnify:CR=1 FL=1|jgi:hypothetical protein
MKDKVFVVSKMRVMLLAVVMLAFTVVNFWTPKNELAEKMIVEFNDKETCEVLLWNGEELVARLYLNDKQSCKFYLIKNPGD